MKPRLFFFSGVFILLTVVGYFEFIKDNFHVVIPGEVYRSAQLSPGKLTSVINQYHIHAIINLRGAWEQEAFYQEEIAVSKKNHVKHYDLKLNPKSLPTSNQLNQLIYLLQHAPRPLLIHCKDGADRTGLASAIVLTLAGHSTQNEIDKQFTWRYLAFSTNSVGKLVFAQYNQWLDKNHKQTSPSNFMNWVHL